MARINKFASVNLNDLFGKKEPAVKTAGNSSGSGARPKGASHGMLVLTHPVKQPVKFGPGSTGNLRKQSSESLTQTANNTRGWSNTSHIESENGGIVKDNSEPVHPTNKPESYIPPSLRDSHSTSVSSLSVELEPVTVGKTAVIHGDEFPSLQASLAPTNTNGQQHRTKDLQQKQKDNQLDAKEQLGKLQQLALQAHSKSTLDNANEIDMHRFQPQRPEFFRPPHLRGDQQAKPEMVAERPDGSLSRDSYLMDDNIASDWAGDKRANGFRVRPHSINSDKRPGSDGYSDRIDRSDGFIKGSPSHGSIHPLELAPSVSIVSLKEDNNTMFPPPCKGGRYEREALSQPGSGGSRYFDWEALPRPGSGGSGHEREALPRPGSGGSRYAREALPWPGSGGSRYERERLPRPGSGGIKFDQEAFLQSVSSGSRYERQAIAGGSKYEREAFPQSRSDDSRFEREVLLRPSSGGSRYEREAFPRPGSGDSRYEREAFPQSRSGDRFEPEALLRPVSGARYEREVLLQPGSGGRRYEREAFPRPGSGGSRFKQEELPRPVSGGSRYGKETLAYPTLGERRYDRQVSSYLGSGGGMQEREIMSSSGYGGEIYGSEVIPHPGSGYSYDREVISQPASGGDIYSRRGSGGSEYGREESSWPGTTTVCYPQQGFNEGSDYVRPNSGARSYEREVVSRPGSWGNRNNQPGSGGVDNRMSRPGPGVNGQIDGGELYRGSSFNGNQNYQRRVTNPSRGHADAHYRGRNGNMHHAYESNREKGSFQDNWFRPGGSSRKLPNKDNYCRRGGQTVVEGYERDSAHDSGAHDSASTRENSLWAEGLPLEQLRERDGRFGASAGVARDVIGDGYSISNVAQSEPWRMMPGGFDFHSLKPGSGGSGVHGGVKFLGSLDYVESPSDFDHASTPQGKDEFAGLSEGNGNLQTQADKISSMNLRACSKTEGTEYDHTQKLETDQEKICMAGMINDDLFGNKVGTTEAQQNSCDEQPRQTFTDGEQRKVAARKKLLELEEQIAKRESEQKMRLQTFK